ncbi:hypothetical protein GWK47_000373 [Chionoecetes opilio]|uniref:Uncharacterized protein n=1 Tax=Chionoecetes opilio TaxID=41210 RepID=A0A8J4YGK8_CHIOP|nr:hypothetical protein GWK47_000373 [Chionoecetes opilio]
METVGSNTETRHGTLKTGGTGEWCLRNNLPNPYRQTAHMCGAWHYCQRACSCRGSSPEPSPSQTSNLARAYPSSSRRIWPLIRPAASSAICPIRVAFCLTINKCQGPNQEHVGSLLWPQPVFSTTATLRQPGPRVCCADAVEVLARPVGITRNVV